MNWEAWLRSAANPPSDNEDDKRKRAEAQIRDALANYVGLQGRQYVVYAKGSYANNTNVRLNYDVDIAVEYCGFFYYDICLGLDGWTKEAIGIQPIADPYTRDNFKRDIRAALVQAFGATAVENGRIAYRVRQKKTTLPADVVPCWEFRRYDTLFLGTPNYSEGSRVYPSTGPHKDNYPKKQLTNGTAKNNRTSYRYKRMVRALKKVQTKLVSDGKLDKELASYLTESLVYNVGDPSFNHPTYLQDMRGVLAAIFNATLDGGGSNDWEHVHGLEYLFRGNQGWTTTQVHTMASVAWDAMGCG